MPVYGPDRGYGCTMKGLEKRLYGLEVAALEAKPAGAFMVDTEASSLEALPAGVSWVDTGAAARAAMAVIAAVCAAATADWAVAVAALSSAPAASSIAALAVDGSWSEVSLGVVGGTTSSSVSERLTSPMAALGGVLETRL